MLNVRFCKQEILFWINKAQSKSNLICIKLTPRSSKKVQGVSVVSKTQKKLALAQQHRFKMLILIIDVEFQDNFSSQQDTSHAYV